jgi:hypothetical protein
VRYIVTVLTLLASIQGSAVTIKVQNASGEAERNVLVIVQNLDDHEREVMRVLTDQEGRVPAADLSPGLYRVIATAPYGLIQTKIDEFLVGSKPRNVVMTVQFLATHGYGDVVTVPQSWTHLQVVRPDGKPAAGADVHVRDRDATLYLERWYRTDEEGRVTIEQVSDPAVVVIVYKGALTSLEIGSGTVNPIVHLKGE